MIERALAANGGRGEVGYGEDGLRCVVSVPLPQAADGILPGLEARIQMSDTIRESGSA